jgi:hypothetical protein
MFAESARMSVRVWPKNNRDVFTHNIFNHYDVASPHAWEQTVDDNWFTDAAAFHGNQADSTITR